MGNLFIAFDGLLPIPAVTTNLRKPCQLTVRSSTASTLPRSPQTRIRRRILEDLTRISMIRLSLTSRRRIFASPLFARWNFLRRNDLMRVHCEVETSKYRGLPASCVRWLVHGKLDLVQILSSHGFFHDVQKYARMNPPPYDHRKQHFQLAK
ncbi:hypothetical protein ABKN59_009083 [Abortiporus biennis]